MAVVLRFGPPDQGIPFRLNTRYTQENNTLSGGPMRQLLLALSLVLALLSGCSDDKKTATPHDAVPSDCAGASCDTQDVIDLSRMDLEDVAPPPPLAACAPLEPVAHLDPVEVVGDGSAASCDEGSLRAAVDAINQEHGGTIAFDCGGEHTITLTSALFLDAGSSTEATPILIDGGGVITLSGGGTTRILDLEHYTQLLIQSITLREGFVADEADGDPADSGAAIRHPWYGTLHAIDVRFEDNHCQSMEGEIGGGAVFAGGLSDAVFSGCVFVGNSASNGGGLQNRGSNLTLINSVFQGNGALSVGDGQFGNGGGVYIDGMNYDDPGDLTVCGTIFRENTAMTHGSGMFSYFYPGSNSTIELSVFDGNRFGNPAAGSGGLYHEAAPLTLRNTTLSNHVTGDHAGGLFLGSGSTATITNCTFANNRVVSNGAGIFNGAASADLINCTFTGNDADYGPAIFKGQNAAMTLTNTVFANNTTANQYSATSCHEPMGDGGGNLQWPANKNNGNPDPPCVDGITFADPVLQPLADNGGTGQTSALGAGSAAIDFGTGVGCPETDQRGMPRVGACDSGAFEFQGE